MVSLPFIVSLTVRNWPALKAGQADLTPVFRPVAAKKVGKVDTETARKVSDQSALRTFMGRWFTKEANLPSQVFTHKQAMEGDISGTDQATKFMGRQLARTASKEMGKRMSTFRGARLASNPGHQPRAGARDAIPPARKTFSTTRLALFRDPYTICDPRMPPGRNGARFAAPKRVSVEART